MTSKIDIKPGEIEIFSTAKGKRYFLIVGVLTLFAVFGLAYFMVTWAYHFPAFMLNNHTSIMMNLSGVVLALVLITTTVINVRESKGFIVLTDERLIIPTARKPYLIKVPLRRIKEISLGRSPLETISGCGSLWIKLVGESDADSLAGPLPWKQAELLYQLINKELTRY